MFAGNDVVAISSLGALQVISDYGFWKCDPDFIFMFNWHFLSILKGLDEIRLFLFGWDFPTGCEIVGVWDKMTTKRHMREKHLLGGYFLTPNCVFWAIVCEIISIGLACAGAQEKRQEGRQEL